MFEFVNVNYAVEKPEVFGILIRDYEDHHTRTDEDEPDGFLGIVAEAIIVIPKDRTGRARGQLQRIQSSGIWAISYDHADRVLAEKAQEQFDDLIDTLAKLGIGDLPAFEELREVREERDARFALQWGPDDFATGTSRLAVMTRPNRGDGA